MHRIFIDESSIIDGFIKVSDKDTHHLIHVLRVEEHELIEAVSENSIYTCIITDSFYNHGHLAIDGKRSKNPKAHNITLFQGLSKADKMEFIIKSCTEVGIDEFYPTKMHRSISNLEKGVGKKIDRWQKIAESAAIQSKRLTIPKIHPVISYKEVFKNIPSEDSIVIPYEGEDRINLHSIIPNLNNNINIFIGPEGGFSQEEISLVEDRAHIVTLGRNILRMETAALVTCFSIVNQLGVINER